LIEVG